MIVTLPWPPSKLSRNGSQGDYRGKAGAARKYREDCAVASLTLPKRLALPDGPIRLRIAFCAPDRRRRDLDNLLAMIKQGIDALAERMGVDDQRFEYLITRGEVRKGGAVEVTI